MITETIETPEAWIEVGRYPTLDQAYEHGLVILAMGEAYRVTDAGSPGEYELEAEINPAPGISKELDIYAQETALRKVKPTTDREWHRYPAGRWVTALWALALVAVFYWQEQDASLVDRAASSSIALVRQGEWWRPLTALFLHADLAHLIGNLLSGIFFGTLVSRSIGPVLGWMLILGSGAVGNAFVSRLTYPEVFVSLGASTAVFAALGILSGVGVMETLRDWAVLPWLRLFAPVLAGLVMLGWLGGGPSGNTDVLGHIFGFGTGIVAGVATAAVEAKRTARID